MTLGNHSIITQFLLLGLSTDPHIQALIFVLFLEIYLLTLTGNLMLLLVIRADSHRHTPMFFFLSHLSLSPEPLFIFSHCAQDAEGTPV